MVPYRAVRLLHIAERAGPRHHRHQSGPKYPRPTGGSLHPRFRLFKPEAKATFDYEIESAYQFGRSALRPGSPPLTTFAYFQHAEVGYTFDHSWTPSIRFKYDYASGDSDPNDNKNGRFNTLFGVGNTDLTHSGIWGLFKRSNLSSPGYVLSSRA